MIKNYVKEDYLSVWVGKCENIELFNAYIKFHYLEDDDESCTFELGKDFEILTYEEEYSLVHYGEVTTKNISELLDTGAPDYVTEYFVKKYGSCLQKEYNCCVMFYDMKYEGQVEEVINEQYGEFKFLGSMVADKFDLL